MKTIRIIYLLPLTILMMGATSCIKDVGDPVLTPSEKTVAVNQEVTITLIDVKNSNCHTWQKVNGPDYTVISGGKESDKSWTIKFTTSGTAIIQCDVDYCKYVSHGAPCGGHGCSGAETAQTAITIQ